MQGRNYQQGVFRRVLDHCENINRDINNLESQPEWGNFTNLVNQAQNYPNPNLLMLVGGRYQRFWMNVDNDLTARADQFESLIRQLGLGLNQAVLDHNLQHIRVVVESTMDRLKNVLRILEFGFTQYQSNIGQGQGSGNNSQEFN